MRVFKTRALRRALCSLLPVVVLLGLAGCGKAEQSDYVSDKIAAAAEGIKDTSLPSRITYEGVTYKLNRDLDTVLFLGIDSEAIAEAREVVGSGGRADTIMLFVLNDDNRTARVLELSRDTMTDVDVYNNDRKLLYSGTMQIDMQYAFGESSARSCALMKGKVSALMEGLRIDSVCSLTINGLVDVVNAMGGITVTLDEDYPEIDPTYTAGAVITMDGATVEDFVRYRNTDVFASNDARMQRQDAFVTELFTGITEYNTEQFAELYEAAGNQLCTDLTADRLLDYAGYTLLETIKIPGETVAGDLHDEYYIDADALHALIVQIFYLPA